MALKTAAERVETRRPGPRCGLGTILATLTPEDVTFFDEMVADEKTYTYIADVFKEDGHPVSADKVSRHVKGRCACR